MQVSIHPVVQCNKHPAASLINFAVADLGISKEGFQLCDFESSLIFINDDIILVAIIIINNY